MRKHLYFMAIIPPAEIADKITIVKKEMAEKFNNRHALKSPAHITLQMPFKREETMEAPIAGFMKAFSERQDPFEVELNGFGHFDDRVIFINVLENDKLKSLHTKLNSALRSELNFTENETPLKFHPHVTVAHRDLIVPQFELAWPQFQKRNFTAQFSVHQLSLLKHNFKFWEVINSFPYLSGRQAFLNK